jgi:hypothetical protein
MTPEELARAFLETIESFADTYDVKIRMDADEGIDIVGDDFAIFVSEIVVNAEKECAHFLSYVHPGKWDRFEL